MPRFIRFAVLSSLFALLSGCAGPLPAAESSVRIEYGTVEAIEIDRASENGPINPGTVLGGIAGGVIGHQIGGGRGKTAATIAGSLGGAVVGHELNERANGPRYRVTVRLDSGSTLIVEETHEVDLRAGDRVRVENDHVHRL